MSDTFAYACADAEPITFDAIPELLALNKKYKGYGLDAWVSLRRGQDVIIEHQTEEYFFAKKELMAKEPQSAFIVAEEHRSDL